MLMIAFEFVMFAGAIVVGLLALSGMIAAINYAWNIFMTALKGK